MSGFLSKIIGNADAIGTGLKVGGQLGDAVSTLGQGRNSDKIVEETTKTIDAFSEVSARRIEREMNYYQGQARAEIGSMGGQHGSNVFRAAANARRAEENRQEAFLQAERQKSAVVAGKPIPQNAASFTGRLLGVGASAIADYKELDTARRGY